MGAAPSVPPGCFLVTARTPDGASVVLPNWFTSKSSVMELTMHLSGHLDRSPISLTLSHNGEVMSKNELLESYNSGNNAMKVSCSFKMDVDPENSDYESRVAYKFGNRVMRTSQPLLFSKTIGDLTEYIASQLQQDSSNLKLYISQVLLKQDKCIGFYEPMEPMESMEPIEQIETATIQVKTKFVQIDVDLSELDCKQDEYSFISFEWPSNRQIATQAFWLCLSRHIGAYVRENTLFLVHAKSAHVIDNFDSLVRVVAAQSIDVTHGMVNIQFMIKKGSLQDRITAVNIINQLIWFAENKKIMDNALDETFEQMWKLLHKFGLTSSDFTWQSLQEAHQDMRDKQYKMARLHLQHAKCFLSIEADIDTDIETVE